jgi:NADH-quinone oxidoreductase subunit E
MALSEEFQAKARELIARYPEPRSALIMLLHEAQDEIGYLSSDGIREVAAVLGLSAADVAGVATFYTMFKRRPTGRNLISVCRNVSCMIQGSDETAAAMEEVLGEPNEVSADGSCSWEAVECLATCHWAPAAQVNYLDVPYLTPDRARLLVNRLQAGSSLDEVLVELRSASSLEEARRG